MRRLITSFLVLAAATACADDPITPGSPEPGRPVADIIHTGGLSDFGAQNDASQPDGIWVPLGWRLPFGFGSFGELCWDDGFCGEGSLVSEFGNLEEPESPYLLPGTGFAFIATQQFYQDTSSVAESKVALVPVLASGIEVDFVVPSSGAWALSFDYAVLAAGGPVDMEHDDAARMLLLTDAAFDAPGNAVATPLEVHRSELSGGGCGTLELLGPDFEDPTTITSASYDDCTGWQRLQFDLSEWAGQKLTLRFLVEEVGGDDGNPIALVFDNVQVLETFTGEGAVGTPINLSVTRPFISHRDPPAVAVFDTFAWTIDAGCTLSSTIDPAPTAACSSPGTYEVVARMTEDEIPFDPDVGLSERGVYYALGTLIVTDPNMPPAVDEVAAPADPVRLGDPVTVSASFTDPDVDDVHTVTVDWGDGMSTTLTLPAGARNATATHN